MSVFGKISVNILGDELSCPKCGGNNLHQCNTTIFERSEDAETTTVIAQSGHEVYASKFPSADTCNPSLRRHGMLIEFQCESCHYDYGSDVTPDGESELFRLAILQHKGTTYVEWV